MFRLVLVVSRIRGLCCCFQRDAADRRQSLRVARIQRAVLIRDGRDSVSLGRARRTGTVIATMTTTVITGAPTVSYCDGPRQHLYRDQDSFFRPTPHRAFVRPRAIASSLSLAGRGKNPKRRSVFSRASTLANVTAPPITIPARSYSGGEGRAGLRSQGATRSCRSTRRSSPAGLSLSLNHLR